MLQIWRSAKNGNTQRISMIPNAKLVNTNKFEHNRGLPVQTAQGVGVTTVTQAALTLLIGVCQTTLFSKTSKWPKRVFLSSSLCLHPIDSVSFKNRITHQKRVPQFPTKSGSGWVRGNSSCLAVCYRGNSNDRSTFDV